jgi:DNA-binding MarR family transcriptional regulator
LRHVGVSARTWTASAAPHRTAVAPQGNIRHGDRTWWHSDPALLRRVQQDLAMTSHGPAHEPASEPSAVPAASPEPHALKLEEFLPYRLNVLAALVSQALSSIYADRYGIGVPEWRVLVTLGEFGMMTGKAVGTHSHMHKTKVSRAVALLEKRKLVSRRVNRADMREAFLSLTPSGRAMYEELAPIALEFAARLFEVLDASDRIGFDRSVRCLTARSAELAAEMAKRAEEE